MQTKYKILAGMGAGVLATGGLAAILYPKSQKESVLDTMLPDTTEELDYNELTPIITTREGNNIFYEAYCNRINHKLIAK